MSRSRGKETRLGMLVKKLAADHDECVVDMCVRTGVHAPIVSRVLTGNKPPPIGFETILMDAYPDMTPEQEARLWRLCARARKQLRLHVEKEETKILLAKIAAYGDLLDEADLHDLHTMLDERVRKIGRRPKKE